MQAALLAQVSERAADIAIVGVVALLLGAAGVVYGIAQRRKRLEIIRAIESARERAAEAAADARPDPPGPDRDEDIALQRQIGQIHLAKLEAELALLRRQVESKDLDDDRTVAAKEYHELMVEKARLEIDSLRIHIAEQRRRMDVWRDDEGL